jgi:hypothetical protein
MSGLGLGLLPLELLLEEWLLSSELCVVCDEAVDMLTSCREEWLVSELAWELGVEMRTVARCCIDSKHRIHAAKANREMWGWSTNDASLRRMLLC